MLVVLECLRGEDNISELCHKESITQGLRYPWPKELMEPGKRRLAEMQRVLLY